MEISVDGLIMLVQTGKRSRTIDLCKVNDIEKLKENSEKKV